MLTRIFDEASLEQPVKKKRTRRGSVSHWLVTFFTFSATCVLGYQLFLTNRELSKLRMTVADFRHERIAENEPNKSARAGTAKRITDDKKNVFDVFTVDLNKTSMKLYYLDDEGGRIGSFQRLKDFLDDRGQELVFATNGGMYTPEGAPVGLLVANGKEVVPLNVKGSGTDGNFYLKPNGVFALTKKEAVVMESAQFAAWAQKDLVVFATQSGPLLVADGSIHPKFNKESTNNNIRSGVGIVSPTQVVFVISEKAVNFYDFAMLFLKQLKCKNALYFDGTVSRMYLPALHRYDLDGDFGSIVAVSK
jgi:uncharacterized protein YigE (DUF2233 family)